MSGVAGQWRIMDIRIPHLSGDHHYRVGQPKMGWNGSKQLERSSLWEKSAIVWLPLSLWQVQMAVIYACSRRYLEVWFETFQASGGGGAGACGGVRGRQRCWCALKLAQQVVSSSSEWNSQIAAAVWLSRSSALKWQYFLCKTQCENSWNMPIFMPVIKLSGLSW